MKSELYTDEEINSILAKKEEGAKHEVAPPIIREDAENPPSTGGEIEDSDPQN